MSSKGRFIKGTSTFPRDRRPLGAGPRATRSVSSAPGAASTAQAEETQRNNSGMMEMPIRPPLISFSGEVSIPDSGGSGRGVGGRDP